MKTYFTTTAALATLTLATEIRNQLNAFLSDETMEVEEPTGMTKERRREIEDLFWPKTCDSTQFNCQSPVCVDL